MYYAKMLQQLRNRRYPNGKTIDVRPEAEKINRKTEKGEKMTAQQKDFAEVYASESVSIMAELTMGNGHFARRLPDADYLILATRSWYIKNRVHS